MKFWKLSLFPLLWAAAFGQQAPLPPDGAPPEVEHALRARVDQFYSANVTGKWRDAFQVVADDMQNEYLGEKKDTYDRCETTKITYSDNFTKAAVQETCHGVYRWHNSHIPATIPVTSTWKLVDGQWFWYYVKPTEVMTPWGLSTVQPDAPLPDGSAVNKQIETVLKDPAAVANEILGQIKVNKKQIHLLGYENSKDELRILNGMPGTVSVSIVCPPLPGFHIKQDKVDVGSKETSTIVFAYDPEEAKKQCGECFKLAKPILTATVRIAPTAQAFPVRITFAIPPEMEKQLPKELRQPPAKQ